MLGFILFTLFLLTITVINRNVKKRHIRHSQQIAAHLSTVADEKGLVYGVIVHHDDEGYLVDIGGTEEVLMDNISVGILDEVEGLLIVRGTKFYMVQAVLIGNLCDHKGEDYD